MGQLSDHYNEPKLSKTPGWKGDRLYRNYLRDEMRGRGLGTEQAYRSEAYRGIGQQQHQADMATRQGLAGGFGAQNPTGLSAALLGQNALAAPYGEANMAAQELKRRSMINTGSAYEASLQNQVNRYLGLLSPLYQERALQLQQAALESQNALALAGSAGGGGGDAFLGGLGSGLGQGASSNIAGG